MATYVGDVHPENGRVAASQSFSYPQRIIKRDGRLVAFDSQRPTLALERCFAALGQQPATPLSWITLAAVNIVSVNGSTPTVEHMQDAVEKALLAAGEFEAARAYIVYRAEHAKLRGRPVPAEVKAKFDEADRYFPSPLQKFNFLDKYSRFDYSTGRRETWPETVERAVSFLHELAGSRVSADDYARIRQAILNLEAMPSMRLLAMAGEAARRDCLTVFNCAYSVVDSLDAFSEAVLIGMAGCGLGYSVESRYVENLPRIKRQRGVEPDVLLVEDTAEGWAKALRTGLELWFDGYDVRFDLSQVRPAGSVLRVKGGRSSGPGPLRQMLDFVRARVLRRQGSYLRPLDAHDLMCAAGLAVVSGGVRRTALLSLFDFDDTEMRDCKSGDFERDNSQRWMANNSAVWPESGLTQPQMVEQMMVMVKSERGEPGIFNRKSSFEHQPEWRKALGYFEAGTNPCFAPGTLIHTRDGHFPVESLVGKEVDIWNGERWQTVDNFRVTAENQPVLKITLHDGSELRVTPYHKMILDDGRRIEARELVPDMRLAISEAPLTHGNLSEPGAYLKGFLLGDGTSQKERAILRLFSTKYECADRLARSAEQLPLEADVRSDAIAVAGFGREDHRQQRKNMQGLVGRHAALMDWTTTYRERLPERVFAWDQATKLEFIAGYMDADGTVMDSVNAFGYQISSIHRELLLDIQALLKTIGARSKLSLMKAGGKKDFNDGYGEYDAKDCWRLTISQAASIVLARQVVFARLKSLSDKTTTYQQRPRFNRVTSVEPDGVYDKVYCCTVPGSHSLALTNGMQSGQCGEVVLKPQELCNLSVCVSRKDDTLESLERKVEIASLIGTIQSLATNFPSLRPIWKFNCEEERLLGVDITGQMDCPTVQDGAVMRRLRERVIDTNVRYAAQLGINRSASLTVVKPSGNSSQLLDCSSGLHTRYAAYYERNVRVSATSPLFKVLRDAGVPMDPENGQTPEDANTFVIHFPVKSPDGAITRHDRTAVQQCDYWLLNKLNWTTMNPSVTISYRPDEVIDIIKWVWDHKDVIGGMAFLPTYDAQYAQLPYIEISKEEYERRIAEFPPIDFSRVYAYEVDDTTEAAQTLACSSGLCET